MRPLEPAAEAPAPSRADELLAEIREDHAATLAREIATVRRIAE